MKKAESFNPNRLKFARKRRGLTICALSAAVGITSRTLSDYENGRRSPTKDSLLSSIAKELQFPEQFFLLDDILSIEENAVSFRSMARMSALVRDSAIGAAQIALEFTSWLEKKFEMPSVDIPDLRGHDPEVAAEMIRDIWGIGALTIRNMIHLLEAKGVRVFSLIENTYDMDAYSFWMNDKPFIFLNTKKSVERSRFDAAHELGHLVLHKEGAPIGKEAETEANRFASALLMPSSSVISRAPRFHTLETIITHKALWLVSAAALIRRMKDLSLLSEWHYRNLMIELSEKGFLKNESNPISQRETSKLFPMIIQALRKDGVNINDVASELHVFVEEINNLLFNLTLISFDGGVEDVPVTKTRNKSHLRLV